MPHTFAVSGAGDVNGDGFVTFLLGHTGLTLPPEMMDAFFFILAEGRSAQMRHGVLMAGKPTVAWAIQLPVQAT